MSDLSLQLQQAASQLPVSSYFDEALYKREMESIFQSGPRYVGHQLSVPNNGDYYALPQEGGGRALLRTQKGVELISNVCRHRQAVILKDRGSIEAGRGAGGNIVCPAALAGMGPRADLDFTGMVLDRVELHECNYNWKTFIEVYLEDYHVGPFHPGLGSMVTCDDLQWEFNQDYSVQTVGVAHRLKAGSPVYQRWHDALMQYRQGKQPRYGAIWLTYYPHIMVEWYPHVLTVSTLHPMGPQKTMNMVEFYYPEEIAAFEREFVEAQQAAYMETCLEDDEIGERMDAGRLALMRRGDNEVGPYQSPMEDGMQHFHEWYRRRVPAPLLKP
ncbi:MAG: dioxygenase-like protein [Ramlibacter sp.]|nr:dioxygenase-like protein [Ramlibacter sp.]